MKDPLSHFHVYSSPGGLIVPLDIHIQGHLVISLSIPSHQMALEILLFETLRLLLTLLLSLQTSTKVVVYLTLPNCSAY